MSPTAGELHHHPAPHRGRVSIVSSLAALAAGPAAWILQLVVGYGVSSMACFPHDAPRPVAASHAVMNTTALAALNLVCLALAIAALVTALIHWRRVRHEKQGGVHRTIDVGEGRTRFLAVCGILSAAGFAVAILFDMPAILTVPACWSAM